MKPMFYELACDNCDASGLVYKDTGGLVPDKEAKAQLRLLLEDCKQELAEMRARLMNLTGSERANSHGVGGSHYRGD